MQHAIASIASQLDHGARAVPAVRLVGRVAEPRRLRPLRASAQHARCSPSSPPAIPRRPASTSASAAIICSSRCTPPGRACSASTGARRSPMLDDAWAPDLVVQGNLDPALVLAGRGPRSAGADAVLADNDGHPGHIFNLGHGVQPNTDPDVLARRRRSCEGAHGSMTERAYGSDADGLRHAAHAGRHLAVLHRHPTRQSADRPTARRPDRRATTRSAASRRWPNAAKRSATRCRRRSTTLDPGRFHVTLGMKHAPPFIEASVEELRVARFPTRRRAGARAALLGVLRRPVPRPADRCGRSCTTWPSRGVRSWATEPAFIDFIADDVRASSRRCRPARVSCSPRTRCPQRILASGDPYPVGDRGNRRQCRRRRRPGPRRLGARLAERRPHAGAVAGTRHPDGHRRLGADDRHERACWSAQSDSSPTTSRCCTTSTSRPPAGRRTGASRSPAPHASTTIRR